MLLLANRGGGCFWRMLLFHQVRRWWCGVNRKKKVERVISMLAARGNCTRPSHVYCVKARPKQRRNKNRRKSGSVGKQNEICMEGCVGLFYILIRMFAEGTLQRAGSTIDPM